MDKQDYYKASESLDLPKRCPILNRCGRRAFSIYLLGYHDIDTSKIENVDEFLLSHGEVDKDYIDSKVLIQGEKPSMIKGANNIYFDGVCPEVNLFDKGKGMFFSKGIACTSGDWDNYREKPKERIHECKHYSECPEFNKYKFDNELQKKVTKISQIEMIKDYLVKGEINSALICLKKACENLESGEQVKNCIILMNRFRESINKEIQGVEAPDTIRIEKNKIVKGILEISDSLKD